MSDAVERTGRNVPLEKWEARILALFVSALTGAGLYFFLDAKADSQEAIRRMREHVPIVEPAENDSHR